MSKLAIVLIGLILLATSALALDVTVRSFCDNVGVRLSLDAKTVSLQSGQTLAAAKVSNPSQLSGYGIPSTMVGDQMSVTYNGGKSFTLKHVKSGKQITIQALSLN